MTAPRSVPPMTELVTKAQLVAKHPHLLSANRVAWGATPPGCERAVGCRLRIPMCGAADSRAVLPRVVPWPQRPRQAACRADGTPRVERVDQNRQVPAALLRRPANSLWIGQQIGQNRRADLQNTRRQRLVLTLHRPLAIGFRKRRRGELDVGARDLQSVRRSSPLPGLTQDFLNNGDTPVPR